MTGEISIGSTYGVVIIGVFVASTLHGLTCLQAIIYYRTFDKDTWRMKSLVGFLMAFECLQIALCWYFVYHYFVNSVNNPLILLVPIWSALATIPVTSVVELLCHLFFTHRIWRLSERNWILCSSIVLVELARFGVTLLITIKSFKMPLWTDFPDQMKSVTTAGLVLSVCSDFCITGSLCYYLHRCRTGFRKTDTLVTSLLLYTINNGIATAIGDIIILGLFLAFPTSLAFFAVFQLTSKLYANALLTTLNSRKSLRSRLLASELSTNQSPPLGRSFKLSAVHPNTPPPPASAAGLGPIKFYSSKVRSETRGATRNSSVDWSVGKSWMGSFGTKEKNEDVYPAFVKIERTIEIDFDDTPAPSPISPYENENNGDPIQGPRRPEHSV
ncbi:hypothetical protein SISSUDRAFT_631691 [Sistotremastrum suecicum HHB10207 ss-3]|uniref:DUF6534 domain-containing protein n=1 Tax=Sistotremastrum suecicum HHB10207 ss-3 TaxID=1314776 RepID=A0A166EH99_9AGAM|nr:hypothetical protein SISSUDRAFT_631691 [Sistotremastrum suecicum HHB10207 ss-3]